MPAAPQWLVVRGQRLDLCRGIVSFSFTSALRLAVPFVEKTAKTRSAFTGEAASSHHYAPLIARSGLPSCHVKDHGH